MGLVSFLRTVLTGTDSGRHEFTSGPVSAYIAARGANASTSNMNAVLGAPVTREFAMQVPAVLRGRNVICSIATLPLITVDRTTRERIESSLLTQIDPQVPNIVTLAQTLEDLIFDGIAWWKVTKYGPGPDGFPLNARHLDSARVSVKPPYPGAANRLPSGVDPSSVVWIDGQPVNGTTLVRFDSPNPPLLTVGKRTIKRAALLDAAASMYAEDPRPLDYLTPAEDADPDMDDVQDVMDKWLEARRKRATGWVPSTLTYHEVDSPTPADLQLVELQQRTDLALANMLGLDPEDVGVSTTSRTYANATDRRRDKINDTLAPYMLAITSRLSMNDVSRRAEQVMFDLTDYLKADPATQAEVAGIYLDRNVLSAQEVRADLGRPDVPVEPAPAQRASRAAVPAAAQPATQLEEPRVSIPATFSVAAPEADTEAPSIRRVTFAVPVGTAEFTVDVEKRTVSGLAVPYGEVTSDWRKIAFAAGSIGVPTPLSRVKAIMNHYGSLLGVAASTTETDSGLYAKLAVARTTAGDEALALADAGALDGMSVGVDIHEYSVDTETDVTTVTKATLREISLTPFPAFDSARVDKVNLHSQNRSTTMTTVADNGTTPAAAAPGPDLEARFAAILDAKLAQVANPAPIPTGMSLPEDFATQLSASLSAAISEAVAAQVEVRETVNPVREAAFEVVEALPYRLDGGRGEHEFSSDLFASIRHNDGAAKQRLQTFMKEAFVSKANVASLNPSRQRPDLFVDEKDYSTPLWDAVNKGMIEDSTPFILPNFTSASNVIADHTEGTEPTAGTYVTGSQTITPAPMSGKFPLVREIVDQGGNPQLSQIIWAKIRRAWSEALESKVATLLNASSASTITVTTAAVNKALAKEFRVKLAALQFVRGGFRFNALPLHVDLYTAMIGAEDDTGRPLFPFIEGSAANAGSVDAAWGAIRAAGLVGVPSWALGATGSVSANSFLFDRADVSGWATEPRDLNLADQDVANVYIGVWGYQATAVTDVTGVRKLAYDPV